MIKNKMNLFCFLFLLAIPASLEAQEASSSDFDGSGTVDFPDFILFATAFGSSESRFDLNKNGIVDFPDFISFANAFGKMVEMPSLLTAGDSITVNLRGEVTMDFVYIPPGTFMMGSPETETGRTHLESPQHEVTISKGFYLGKYEVTQEQWRKVVLNTPRYSNEEGSNFHEPWIVRGVNDDPNTPVTIVKWSDVQRYIQRLNDAAGDSLYRLPTEAEWEYACRAGTTTRWSFGDDESKIGDYAWYDDNTLQTGSIVAQVVGTKLPNPWGLYDMHGNVSEWCQDWMGSYLEESQIDPVGPSSGVINVLRGGSFFLPALRVRSAHRKYLDIFTDPTFNLVPDHYRLADGATIGFRLVKIIR